MKNNEGVTLVLLSITIIILILLAGVSLAMLTGENGIFISKEKKDKNKAIEDAKSSINLALETIEKEATTKILENTNIIEYYATINLNNYGLDTNKGYKLVTEEGNDATGISKDGIIAIKYEDVKQDIHLIGKIYFEIGTENVENQGISGSPYGKIERAHSI